MLSAVSRFGHLRINAHLPASRSLSQAVASFFASRCQDIHRTPLVSLTSWIEDRSHASSISFAEDLQHALRPFFLKKVYFANRCSSDARSDGKTIENDLSKQASQKSLILTRTSYLIVKEHVLLAPIFIRARKATRQARVSASSEDDRLTHPWATSELFELLGVFVTG